MDDTGTGYAPDGDRVRDVVRDVVAAVAPEELVVVEGLAEFDDDTVVRRLGQGGKRDPLGFGWGDAAAMVTPVVWLILDAAAKKAAGTAVDGAVSGTKTLLRKAFRKREKEAVLPPPTDDRVAELRQQVLDAALEQGLAPARAVEIADAVAKRLKRTGSDGAAG
ncbi:hypothetical protein [Kutzneria buriramensis]|uniref:Uncharacterized protein n=1 Tax=Kutzneria buriramensis TaxID=1045776 RepID=A0A3E0H6R1_9PSEU|nr:hypothetical protein [Kutzneria buriramensis]REH39162.1 hypothetical protein BCF44_11316 [Kutzneria buriramensis]